MKTYTIVAALSLAFAGTSFADGAEYTYPQPSASTKTRAEVKAELAQAMTSADWRANFSEAGAFDVPFVSQKTRAEVKAETLAAIASGELHWLNSEPYPASGNFTPARVQPAAVMTAGVK